MEADQTVKKKKRKKSLGCILTSLLPERGMGPFPLRSSPVREEEGGKKRGGGKKSSRPPTKRSSVAVGSEGKEKKKRKKNKKEVGAGKKGGKIVEALRSPGPRSLEG